MTRNLLGIALAVSLGMLLMWNAACDSNDDDDSNSNDDADDDVDNHDDDTPSDDDTVDDDTADDDAEETVLLDQFQPLLIQKLAQDYETLNYPPASDLIGELSLHPGNADFDYLVQVDTAAPVMYRFTAQADIRGTVYQQLLYAFFYPERPLLATFQENPMWYLLHWYEVGAIDGKLVRITLDTDNQTPLFIEFMQSCGCGWKLFVNQTIDDAAQEEFEAAGQPYPGLAKPEAPHDVQYVFIMPADAADAQSYPVVMDDFGWTDSAHNILAAFTSYKQWLGSEFTVDRGVLYVPQDLDVETPDADPLEIQYFSRLLYDTLYSLAPVGGEAVEVGIFDELGYIWNAYSLFWKYMRNHTDRTEFPGTPRDPAAFEVVHETMNFWDQQTLFETFIYLPESLFGPER